MAKTIFISGASGNLGKATVEKFLAEGHQVIATVSPGKGLGFMANRLQTVEVDLANEKSVDATIQSVITKNKKIDAAVLLVGGFAMGGIKETDGAAIQKMINLNFETAYFCVRPLFIQMQMQGGGRIVLVGARPALKAADGKNMLAYALSKSLLFKLAEFLNAEGKLQNIVTSVVVPSTIDTPVNRNAMPDADFSAWVKPEVIAEVISFAINTPDLREPVFKVYGNS
jgi:NAD(P)-dependent dehydrogenase (short-subunit alcohol dehydrogenase family)